MSLTDCLKAKAFKWGSTQSKSFTKLKQSLCLALVLMIHDFEKPFQVETDVSATCLGGETYRIF